MTIRKEVEGILELHLGENGWKDTFHAAEVQGKLTGSRTNKIIRILCEKVEELENEISSQSAK